MIRMILALALVFSGDALAAKKVDYSGCVLESAGFTLDSEGNLEGAEEIEPNVFQKKEGKETIILKKDPNTGRPYSLKRTYPGESGGKTSVFTTFNYDRKKRCYINEMIHTDPARTGKRQNVVYYHDLCEDLEKFHDPNKPQNRRNLEVTYKRIGKVLDKYQAKFAKKKNKGIFGYSREMFQEDPAKVSNDMVRACIKVRDAFSYPYQFTWGAFQFGDFKFGGIPYHEEKEEDEGSSKDAN